MVQTKKIEVINANAKVSSIASDIHKAESRKPDSLTKYANSFISNQMPDVYNPLLQEASLMLPTKMREINQWARFFYRTNPLVSAAINFHSEFAVNGFKNTCPDKKVKQYFDEMAFDIIDLPNLLDFISLEWYKLGNCFREFTKIRTKNGLKNIEDIEEDEEVLTHNNRYRKVTSTMQRKVDEEMLEIKIDKIGNKLNCTKEHPFLCLKNNKDEWIKAKDIKVGDYVKIGKSDNDLNDIGNIDIKQWWFNYEFENKEVVLEDNNNSYSYIKHGYFKGLKYDKTKNDKIKFLNWITNLENKYIDLTYQEVCNMLNIEKKDDFHNMLRFLGQKIPELKYERVHTPQEKTRWYKLDYQFDGDSLIFYKQSHRSFVSNITNIDVNNDFMYLLGYWFGDGWLNENTRYKNEYGLKYSRWDICVGKMYPEFISKIKNTIKNLSLPYKISDGLKNMESSSTVNFYIKDPLFCEWWNNNFGANCLSKRIPQWVFELPNEKIKYFINGFIDSDGYVCKNTVAISLINEQLIQQLFELFIKLGYYPNINHQEKNGLPPNGKHHHCIVHVVSVTNCQDVFVSSLKAKRYKRIFDHNFKGCKKFKVNNNDLYFRVNSIKKYKDKTTVYNFSVEEDESYIANNVVVHNCMPFGIWNDDEGRWDRFITLNPDYVEIEKSLFSDKPSLKLDPDEGLRRIVQNKTPRNLYDQLDPLIVSYVSKGQKVPLSDLEVEIVDENQKNKKEKLTFPQVCHLAKKASMYEVYGTSPVMAAMKTLIYQDLLINAQMSIARRHWKPIKVVKVGDESHSATNKMLDDVEEALSAADASPNSWLIWHNYISVDYIASAGKVMPLDGEYKFVDTQLMRALEISDAVLTNQGMTFANASISLRVMINKYMRFQKILSRFIKDFIYKPVAQVQGFYETDKDTGKRKLIIPEVEWELNKLQDDAQTKTMLQAMQKSGLISKQTVMAYMGLDYDKERDMILQERKEEAEMGLTPPTTGTPTGGKGSSGVELPPVPGAPAGGGGTPIPAGGGAKETGGETPMAGPNPIPTAEVPKA